MAIIVSIYNRLHVDLGLFTRLQSDHQIRNQPHYLMLAAILRCQPKELRGRYHRHPRGNLTWTSLGIIISQENKQLFSSKNVCIILIFLNRLYFQKPKFFKEHN